MNFDESFYTDDFDQEMMDFIVEAGCRFDNVLWVHIDNFLFYSIYFDEFWTCSGKPTRSPHLTKQQFKEKIGMTTKQFTDTNLTFSKADLQDGDICTAVNGEKWYYINKQMHISAAGAEGVVSHNLLSFTEGLEYDPAKSFSIVSVERKGKIIWTKPKDSKVKQEIESIRKQQEELAERLKELEGKV